ncbi:Uncharacterised protein [Mycobacterium tuberculosis]|nr:Uncharacterised protein [Mycobacterium tuberculosis]
MAANAVSTDRPCTESILVVSASRSVARRFTDACARRTRSTSRGALLRRISVPPDTPCVAASSSPASKHTKGTLKRHADRRRSIMVSPFSGQGVGWVSLITRYACSCNFYRCTPGHSSSCRGSPARSRGK